MKKQAVLLLVLMLAPTFMGCFDQKASATRHRWMEIKNATDNLIDEMSYASGAVSVESQDGLSEPLARATSTVNACQTYNIALVSQNRINVDSRLNKVAEKLIMSSDSLLNQTKRGQDAIIKVQQLIKERGTTPDAQKEQEINALLAEMDVAQRNGTAVLMQIQKHYQELETVRLELNKQYGFELPQIKWIGQ